MSKDRWRLLISAWVGLVQLCALGTLILVAATPTPPWIGKCIAVRLSLDGSEATLNTDGTWTIPSWDEIRKMEHSGISMQECLARGLLSRRNELRLNDHPRNDCPAGWETTYKSNPIVKSCSMFDSPYEISA